MCEAKQTSSQRVYVINKCIVYSICVIVTGSLQVLIWFQDHENCGQVGDIIVNVCKTFSALTSVETPHLQANISIKEMDQHFGKYVYCCFADTEENFTQLFGKNEGAF